jgi:hypothetical protein
MSMPRRDIKSRAALRAGMVLLYTVLVILREMIFAFGLGCGRSAYFRADFGEPLTRIDALNGAVRILKPRRR